MFMRYDNQAQRSSPLDTNGYEHDEEDENDPVYGFKDIVWAPPVSPTTRSALVTFFLRLGNFHWVHVHVPMRFDRHTITPVAFDKAGTVTRGTDGADDFRGRIAGQAVLQILEMEYSLRNERLAVRYHFD